MAIYGSEFAQILGNVAAQKRAELEQKGATQRADSAGALQRYLQGQTQGKVDDLGNYSPGTQASEARYMAEQQPALAGATQAAHNKANLDTLQDPRLQQQLNSNGSVGVGDIKVGADPTARLGPAQGNAFLKHATTTYKPINDQLDAAQATIDSLDKGNAASDKLALISEARIAAGAGGSRALKSIMDGLSGGKTANSSFQEALNYIQNTPNTPVMPPAQRDALRESVFARIGQLGQQHQQAQQQLLQQGAVTAPGSDYAGLVNSVATPVQQKLGTMQQMQQAYTKQRAAMAPQNPVSTPAVANPNPTTLDRIRGYFGGGSAPAAPAAQAAPQAAAVKQIGGKTYQKNPQTNLWEEQ